MALIGSIAINMVADTKRFNEGLAKATVGLRAFQQVGQMIGRQNPLLTMAQGASMLAKGVGILLTPAAKFGGYLADWVKLGGSVLGGLFQPLAKALKNSYLGDWVKALGAKFGDTFRGIGGIVGKIAGGIASAATKIVGGLTMIAGAAVNVLGKAISWLGDIVGTVVGAFGELLKQVLVFGGAAVAVGAVIATKMVQSAMAFGEQTDRARVVFGQFADGVIKQAKLMSTAFGVSQKEFIQSASALGSIFKGAGYNQENAAKLSVHFTTLATDLASLVHIPVEEAMGKIQSGLVGMARPLREVGVLMSEEAVETEAARLGIAKLGTELNESQKVQARTSLITKALADAHGNLALTSGSAANSVKGLQGRIDSLMTSIGQSILPMVAQALSGLQLGIEALKVAWEKSGLAAKNTSAGVLEGTQKQVEGVSWIQKAVGWLADKWDWLKLKSLEFFKSATFQLTTFLMRMEETAISMDKLFHGGKGIEEIEGTFGAAIDGAQKLQREIGKLYEQEKKKPPTRATTDALFEEAGKRIQAARDELAKQQQIDPSKIAPGAAASADATKGQQKFASAMESGSKEAANTILRSRFGSTGDPAKAQQTTAAKTTEIANHTQQLVNIAIRGGFAIGQKLAGALEI